MLIGNYKVLGHELKLTANLKLSSQDLSGNTSSSVHAEKGIKAKLLSVSLLIPFKNLVWLRDLTLLAEGVDENGRLKVYDIQEDIARAMNIRQVKFTNNLFVRESARIRAWQVSFSLLEVRSVPEKVEQRQKKNKPLVQSASGSSVGKTNWDDVVAAVDGTLV